MNISSENSFNSHRKDLHFGSNYSELLVISPSHIPQDTKCQLYFCQIRETVLNAWFG